MTNRRRLRIRDAYIRSHCGAMYQGKRGREADALAMRWARLDTGATEAEVNEAMATKARES